MGADQVVELMRGLLTEAALLSARQEAEEQKPKLVGAVVGDPRVKLAFAEAFVSGYRLIVWVSVGLSLGSSLVAWVLLEGQPRRRRGEAGGR